MIPSAATALVISVCAFLVVLLLVRQERRRGQRFAAAGFRGWCDARIEGVGRWLLQSWDHFVKYIVQLNWYYSIHSVLRALLRMIVAVYTRFENLFERNRARTRQLRAEKRQFSTLNHLRQMAEHKEETALSPAEQRKLRKKKLEEKF